ncbi:hypothetical protein BJF80_13095 [Serinicoccus sp. CUA-874]|nr:hypothetical protein BJF80_13095 [Serinicoccus sp. CUA-874]
MDGATPSRVGRVAVVVAVLAAGCGWALVLRHGFPHGDDVLHAMAGQRPGDVRTVEGWLASWHFDYSWRNGRAADAVARLILLGGRPGAAVVGTLVMVLMGLATWPWLRMAGGSRRLVASWAALGLALPFLAVQAHSWLTGEGLLWVSGLANYPLATLSFLVAAAAVSGALRGRGAWLALPVVLYAHIGHEVSAVATLVVTLLALALRRPGRGQRGTWAAVVVSLAASPSWPPPPGCGAGPPRRTSCCRCCRRCRGPR